NHSADGIVAERLAMARTSEEPVLSVKRTCPSSRKSPCALESNAGVQFGRPTVGPSPAGELVEFAPAGTEIFDVSVRCSMFCAPCNNNLPGKRRALHCTNIQSARERGRPRPFQLVSQF